MKLADRERRRLLDEGRLLDDVMDLARAWEGPPPKPVLDAVLRGAPVGPVPAPRCGRSS